MLVRQIEHGERNMPAITERINIDSQHILHSIGYGTDYEPPARIMSLVDEYVENAHHLVDPSYSYVVRDIELVLGPSVVIEGTVVFQNRVIARLLERCQKVAVFALTIGKHLEEMVSHLAEDGRLLQAMVLDAIGSDAAEKVAYYVQDRIAELAGAQGLCTSQRFSPGYCDWSVSQQKMVFRALNGDTAGIRLTRGYLMLPQKSISGIIGIGPCDGSVEGYNPCRTCNKRNCPGRR